MSSNDEPSGARPKIELPTLESFDPRPSVTAAVEVLDALGAKYALIGGLALDVWGIRRATKDADFAVPIGIAERAGLEFATRGAKLIPLRVGGVGVRSDSLRIDFIDRRFYFSSLFEDAIREARASGRSTRVEEHEIPVVSLEHLLAMKMVSGEPKDDQDAHRILDLSILDYARARSVVLEHLGAATANRLDAFARAVGRPEVKGRLYQNGDDPRE